MTERPVLKRRPERDAWLIAWALTLALHVAAFLGFHKMPLLAATPLPAREPEPVQLVFSRPAPETRQSEQPHFFSELPPDRADKAPEKADFLSNVTSRARDLVPGGSGSLPRMQGEGDAPMVKLDPKQAPPRPAPAPQPVPQSTAPAAPPKAESAPATGARGQDAIKNTGAEATPPRQRAPDSASPGSDRIIREAPGPAGASEIHQPEMDNPDGNAGLTGQVSLNTIAWDYAPWLQNFESQLMHRWMAPMAYNLGMLKEGGWALIEVEISRSGKMLRLELLEGHGHPSLISAAQSALRSMAPIEPLPANFPEPTLILRLRMIYPRVHPR